MKKIHSLGVTMKLIVIDPGFNSDEGHHYPMNAFISHQARAFGYRSLIVGPVYYENNKIKKFRRPNFPCRFVLPNHGYEFPISHTDSELYSIALNMFGFGRSNVGIEEALNTYIPISRLQDGDTILLHTAFLSSLHGIASWLNKADLPNIKVRIVLRFPPWFYQKRKDISAILFEETLAVWERITAEVIFFTDVQVYTEYIQQRTSLPVRTTPIGLDLDLKEPVDIPRGNKESGLTFVAAGIPNRAKGSNLLPEAMEQHLASFPQDRFIVQGRSSNPYYDFYTNFVPKPIFQHPNVQLVRKTFSSEEFHHFLKQGDIILSPYCPIEYHFRTSHIFMEALGLNRVVVASKLDWTEEWMGKLGNVGALLPEHNVASLVATMRSARENIDAHRQAVSKITQRVREDNNAKNWLKFVLEESRTS